MGKYMDELSRSMEFLGNQENTIFMGQSVEVAGTAMRNTLLHVDSAKLLELPVEEDFQMGLSVGMALSGMVPISICRNINVVRLDSSDSIFEEYQKAYERSDGISSLLVEWSDKYND